MIIRFKKGARINASAEDTHNELERIRKMCGGDLSLSRIVAESEPEDAVLHSEFDWDNESAAHHWRLQQARKVVQSIEVVHGETASRAYESVTIVEAEAEGPREKPQRVFRTIEDILQNQSARDELLASAIRDAIAYRRRYSALQELSQVFDAVDDFLKKAVV